MTDDGDAAVELLRSPPGLRLDGRVAWVTGASRGLGRAFAFAFAGAGAELLLSARDGDALAGVATRIRDAGGVAHVSAGSISDPDDVAAAAGIARETWGRLDVLVNNAGISPSFDRAEAVDLDAFEQTLAVNVTGTLRCCQAALPLMAAATDADPSASPSVVNVSSIHGERAHERLVAYAASKAAVERLTRTLALEWAARRIRVNCLAPGYTETDMTAGMRASARLHEGLVGRIPFGRFATVEEIVGGALFLAGDASRYVTGTTLTVDGGWSAR